MFLTEGRWAGSGRRWHHPALFSWGGEFTTTLFRKPSQKSKQSLLLCPRSPSDPLPHPSVPRVFIVPVPQPSCVAGIQHSKFKRRDMVWTTPLLRREPFPAVSGAVLSQKKRHMSAQMPRIYGQAQKNAAKRLSSLYICLCPLPMNGHSVVPSRSFCLWRGNIPYSKCIPGRSVFFPSVTQEIPTPGCVLPGLYPPSPQEHVPWLEPVNIADL